MAEIKVDEVLSPGTISGNTVIVNEFEDLKKVKRGDVIVANFPSPLFNPFLIKCGGIIVEEGGILSHAAIVARELGIPCMRMKNARKLLANKKIQLDSQDKIVRIL